MKLWLLIATAFLSAVGASRLPGRAWRGVHRQQNEGQDLYYDGTLQKLAVPQQDGGGDYNFAERENQDAAPQQNGDNNYDFAELERYDAISQQDGDEDYDSAELENYLPSEMGNGFVGLQQDSEEDESDSDFGEEQQDGYSDDEDEGELQQDEGDDDYGNELSMLLQQEGDEEDEDDTEGVAVVAQDGDEEGEGDGTAVAQWWNNRWDGPLHVRCRAGYGLYYVHSIHSNKKEDRLFRWRCKRVLRLRHYYYYYYYYRRYLRHANCFARRINNWDSLMNYHCPTHYYLTGLSSYHSNRKEDRIWTATCCRTPGVCLRSCRWTGYVNNWDAPMTFQTGGVFTGLYSCHSNRKEDRRWKIRYCYSRRC